MTNLRLLLFVLPLAGCAAALTPPPLTASHPASPEAKEAPVAQASETLSLEASQTGNVGPSPEPSSDGMEGHGAHAGHHMRGSSHADHGGDHAQ
jgi:hypothetical protein